ncbi:MAG: Hsp20/alpha crystallin family protein, partial [Nitrospinae bacterium]|nr:Hsp20/alpha crystallin family protein [Nitrospinota bacterium]
LVAEVPGMKEDEVELEITDNLLTLKGDRKLERGGPEDSIHFLERSHGSFVRTFTLPGTVQQDKVKATLKHGLLKVVLPKVEVASQ